MVKLDELGQSLLSVIQEALLIIDDKGKILKANPPAADLFCPVGPGLEGMAVSELFSATTAADLAVLLQDALQGQGIEARSLRLEPAEGNPLFADINAYPVNAGEPGRVVAVSFLDVSKSRDLEERVRSFSEDLHKKVEERTAELEEAKERYRSLFEKAAVPLAWLDTDGVLQSANQPFYSLTGLSQSAEGSFYLPDLIEDEAYASRIAHYMDLLCKGYDAPARFEIEIKHQSGAVLSTEWFIRFEPLTDQTLICIIDITERKAAENAFRESEERYRKLVETSPDSITVSDVNGTIFMVNRRGAELYGAQSEDEIIGRHVLDFIAFKDRERAARYLEKALEEGAVYGLNYEVLRKDGTTYPAEVNVSVIRDAEGRPAAFVAVVRDMSRRDRAEKEIRKSENRYRTLFEYSRDPVYVVTKSGILLDVNQALIEVSGYERHELIGMNVSELYCRPEERQSFMREIEETGSVKDYELKLMKKTGEVADCLITSSVQRDENGRVIAYQGTVRDITREKQDRQALQESERYYRSLIENVSDIILTVDENADIKYRSPSIQAVLDYSPEEFEGKNMFDFIHPDDTDSSRRNFKQALDNPGTVVRNQCRVRCKDGSWSWQESMAKNLLDDPAVKGIVITSRDVTENRLSEIADREREENVKTILSSLADTIIVVLDRKGRHQFVCASADMEQRYGFNCREVTGKDFFELFSTEEAKERLQLVQEVFNTGEPVKKEFCAEFPAGRVWHEITLSPLRSVTGEITAVVGCIHDITRDKELHETRRQLEEQLAQAEKAAALGEMAAGVVHEINNPITAVNFYAQALESEPALPEDSRARAGKIREAGERIKNLLQSLSSYSSTQTAGSEPVELNRIIAQVKDSLEHELEKTPGTAFKLELQEGLPLLQGSPDQLFNLVSNLAINALHAVSPDGGVVRIRTGKRDSELVLEVSDNGQGIDQSDLPNIFTPFFSRKGKGKGTGLGLAIVNRIAGRHGANVDVDSRSGHGTTFTVSFPLEPGNQKTG
ncbi:MAG: PAS domain S-box protein [bacterium]